MMEVERTTDVPLVMWRPTADIRDTKREFVERIERKHEVKIASYWDLHRWSIEHMEEFWEEIWEYGGIIHSRKYRKMLDLSDPKSPRWLEGALFNYAENLLRFRDEQVALITAGEDKPEGEITYAELFEKSKLYAAAFRKMGLKKGDVVACYMSNREEPVFAMLAALSVGAIWTGALPLLGAKAVLNRLEQLRPKVLLTVDRFQENEEEKEMLTKVQEVAAGLPSLERVIVVPSKEESKLKDISRIRNSCFLEDFLATGLDAEGSVPEMTFEQLPASHPVFVNFTSGTTGRPKAIMHAAWTVLTIFRDFKVQNTRERSIVTLSRSPMGWVTWVWYSTLLGVGARILMFEGCPFYLSPTYIWDLVERHRITFLFLPPAVIDELANRNFLPTEKHSLSSLEDIASGSSVVKPKNYDFIYQKVKKDIKFFSGYGCTEMNGMSMGIDSSLPIHRGEITCPSLGMDLRCVDPQGREVIGEPGDLVLARPAPLLPLGLWGDEDGALYHQTYYAKHPGMFCLNDLAEVNPLTRGFVVHCRSDETIKQRGCRFGSSEIYDVVNDLEDVLDSLCVSQYGPEGSERAVLFVRTRGRFDPDTIRNAISTELTPRHVPDVILPVNDIPHNLNGKKMESLVKRLVNGLPFNDETVENRECLDEYRQVPPYLE